MPLLPRDEWPALGLEQLGACPICGGADRQLLRLGLVDHLFEIPGRWDMYSCTQCRTAYIDPRPTLETIHLAYQNYYTHGSEIDDNLEQAVPGWSASLKRSILRAYVRRRYGNDKLRGGDLWAIVMWLRPWLRRRFDGEMRYLPRVSGSRTLLDVGCGSGRFLSCARTAGWQGVGTELDLKSANVARAKGFEVRHGSIDAVTYVPNSFDAITISHVVEHVYEPLAMLTAARKLLKVGGYFWIETPNVLSRGHERFGRGWGGLHPPAHLHLFCRDTLVKLLQEAGFVNVKPAPWRPNFYAFANLSDRTRETKRHFSVKGGLLEWNEEWAEYRDEQKREFVSLIATVGR